MGDADQYFRPFALALEIKTSSKIRAMALDSIEKMIGACGKRGGGGVVGACGDGVSVRTGRGGCAAQLARPSALTLPCPPPPQRTSTCLGACAFAMAAPSGR